MELKILTNKRYKDIFEKYIYRGESTPLTIGTLIVCAFCFLLLIISTFTQFNFSYSWFHSIKQVTYTPIIPTMIFIIYLLGRKYSVVLFILYTLVGFFAIPIFSFGGGLGNLQNYLFGYYFGFLFAIFIEGGMLKKDQTVLNRIYSSLSGILTIHIIGFLYCIVLAIFRVIDFGFIFSVVSVLSGGTILYDIIFSLIIILFAPYIKNVFWICMKPKTTPKERRSARKYSHRTSNSQ